MEKIFTNNIVQRLIELQRVRTGTPFVLTCWTSPCCRGRRTKRRRPSTFWKCCFTAPGSFSTYRTIFWVRVSRPRRPPGAPAAGWTNLLDERANESLILEWKQIGGQALSRLLLGQVAINFDFCAREHWG